MSSSLSVLSLDYSVLEYEFFTFCFCLIDVMTRVKLIWYVFLYHFECLKVEVFVSDYLLRVISRARSELSIFCTDVNHSTKVR